MDEKSKWVTLVFAKPGRVEFHIEVPILRLTMLGPLVGQPGKILERLNQSRVRNHHCHPVLIVEC